MTAEYRLRGVLADLETVHAAISDLSREHALPEDLTTPLRLALDELVAFLSGKEIARFKLPERLELMTDFPLSTFGKVSKKALVEMVAKKLAAEAGSRP